MRFVLLAVAVLMPAMLGGCASVTRGWSEQMQINSEPQGAEVRTSLSQQCVTPCTLQVQRKDEFSVTFAKPGYEPQTVPVTTRLAGGGAAGFAGNVLLGGVIGMGVDAVSGATLEHWPNPVLAVLQPVAPLAPPRQAPPSRRDKRAPGVVQRPPAGASVIATPASYVPPAEREPVLSEADRMMNMRN